MRIIDTSDLKESDRLSSTDKHHIYNGLDCCVTLEVLEALLPQLDNTTSATYDFSKSLMAPVLYMNMRGVLTDREAIQDAIASYSADINRYRSNLDRIIREGIGYELPWVGKGGHPSPVALKAILYDVIGLPPIRKRQPNGTYVSTVNREALEKLNVYTIAQPIVSHILAMRDYGKKLGFLRTEVDTDHRIRTSFNIAGTNTGRLASSLSAFGTGTNLQNIDRRLRRVFVADPGMKFCNIDLEQADARNVGAICYNLFRDSRYLDACESGDLHTSVCRMAWQHLDWTDDPKHNRAVADQSGYRELSYRDLAKKLGHGTNYLGTPPTMAKHTKVDVKAITEFQSKYFAAFPAIRLWHEYVRTEVMTNGRLHNLFNRRRGFFGRRDDESTIREAVAFSPQSSTAEQINIALLEIFRRNLCEPLVQVHDSLLLQYPEHLEDTIVPKILSAAKVTISLIDGRPFTVPVEAKVGWNWADQSAGNANGLIKFRGHDVRTRVEVKKTNVMDRLVY